MSERKIFAGPRIRRIRNERSLTQTAMAEALGISPSYLNLIERNQRPLTVQLLLKLASVYKLDLDGLQAESGTTVAGLKEVFSDPLLTGELPGDQELVEIGEAAPNAASGIVKLIVSNCSDCLISRSCSRMKEATHSFPPRGCHLMKCAMSWRDGPIIIRVSRKRRRVFMPC